ncbi:superinfection immunity protein [Pedobacter psychroterrae]|uniref:Superinfection immunity protein n=1 Tax=Pedobacter psychroterrae TaxID=2530453 RepID=A0A4R0NQN3_9SPHI|nr:superinfection immunity protein [Pedobacter psychroterrae]
MESKTYLLFVILGVIFLFLYLLPSIIGRKKRNALSIFLLNLFLGGTVIGCIFQ